MRQEEVKDDWTAGVKRMKKERRELELRAMTVSERAAASCHGWDGSQHSY